MRRPRLLLVVVPLVLVTVPAMPAQASTLCVERDRAGCFKLLQAALDHAHTGDTIRIGRGTFAGGVHVERSVTLQGSGARATRIQGGGPVLTIGPGAGSAPPSVTISGVTISGGSTTSSVQGGEVQAYRAYGGGVLIPQRGEDLGATVRVVSSVVEGNVAVPKSVYPSPSGAQCPDGDCPFAQGAGGGIYNGGRLTLEDTVVTGNRAGSVAGRKAVASDAQGGGIYSTGPLVLKSSRVVDNESHTRPPNGRYAEGAGIFALTGGLTLRDSTVARNRAWLDSDWPSSVGQGALAGGVFVDGAFVQDSEHVASITRSRIEDNRTVATSSAGNATAFAGGVQGNGQVTITDSVLASNSVVARVADGVPATASADSAGAILNVGAVLSDTRITNNSVTASAPSGTAITGAAGLWAWADDPIELRHSVVSGNEVTSVGHEVTSRGAGIVNVDALTLTASKVTGNVMRARGHEGQAAGGGLFNAQIPDSADYVPVLTLTDTVISQNRIGAPAGVDRRGGGLFTDHPFARHRVQIRDNQPDNCAGC
jgi:hypothetical protein